MTRRWRRRHFLSAAAGAVAGLGLAPARAILDGGGASTASAGALRSPISRPDDLPPRTVGLRSLGGNFRFDPPGLLVEPGSRVVWLNMGDFHTTTAFHPENADLLSVDVPLRIPEGAEPWHSGMLGLDAGTEFEHRFEAEGVHDYFCQPHYSFGMVGRIVVGGSRGGPGTRPRSELVEAARAEMPSIDAVTGDGGRIFEWTSRINGVLYLAARGEGPGPAAEAVADGVAGDAVVRRLLRDGGKEEPFDGALSSFVEGAGDGGDYEELLRRADAAKEVLGAARPGV